MSVNTGRPVRLRNVSGDTNFCAESVSITSTSAPACRVGRLVAGDAAGDAKDDALPFQH
jgi:hypothetical protein